MFYWMAKGFMWALLHAMYRFRVEGRGNLPDDGAFILCSNHIHSLDPATHTILNKRRMRFMGKKELFAHWYGRLFFTMLGAFPVNRGATDIKAYRTTISVLEQGKPMLIFIQGTRMRAIDIKDAKGGAAVFALKTRSPIIPAGISATYGLFSTIRIRYGAPLNLERYYGQRIRSAMIDEVTEYIMEEVRKLCGG